MDNGTNPKSLANLSKPGQTNNPAGSNNTKRIRGSVRSAAFEKVEFWFDQGFLRSRKEVLDLLAREDEAEKSGIHYISCLSAADYTILKQIAGGKYAVDIIEAILNRVMGKAPQMKEEEGEGGQTLEQYIFGILKKGVESGKEQKE